MKRPIGGRVGIAATGEPGLTVPRFQERAVPKKNPRSVREDRRMLKDYIVPAIDTRKARAVTREDVSKLHFKLRDHPYQANKMVALLSKMFNLAQASRYWPCAR